MPNKEIVNHIDMVAPAITYLLEGLFWLIGGIGTALIATLLYIGKGFVTRVDTMDKKLDVLHDVMLQCDGCRDTMHSIKRMATDVDGTDL